MPNTGGETESKQIRLVVDEDLVSKWDDFWESRDEFSSRADLIRTAVAHEMAEPHSPGTSQDTDELAVEMGKLMDRMEDVIDRTGTIERELTELKNESRKAPELGKLATEVYRLIPDDKPGTDPWKAELQQRKVTKNGAIVDESVGPDASESEKRYQAWKGTVESLAEALDKSQYRVQEAIEKLLADTHAVREVEFGGKTRYWKEV